MERVSLLRVPDTQKKVCTLNGSGCGVITLPELTLEEDRWRDTKMRPGSILIHDNTHDNQKQHISIKQCSRKVRRNSRKMHEPVAWKDGGIHLAKRVHVPSDKDSLNAPSISGSRQLLYLTQDFGQKQTTWKYNFMLNSIMSEVSLTPQ